MLSNKKIIPTILLSFMCVSHLTAQYSRTLAIGDRMPDVTVELKNYINPELSFSELEGKLVILDFWGVTCIPCIESIPAMEALQEEFGDRVQIILVTKDPQEAVDRLAARSQIVRDISLPSVVGDTVLSRLFEYRTVPTHAWIDENGVVSQFTGGWNTSAENILRHLKGERFVLPVKREHRDFNPFESLLTEGEGRQLQHLQYFSVIMKRVPSYDSASGGVARDSVTGKPIGVRVINNSIAFLYGTAFGDHSVSGQNPFLNANRRILEVSEPNRFEMPEDRALWDDWRNQNIYCYESHMPLHMSDFVFETMQEDLQRYFGYNAKLVKRSIECLILKQIGDISHMESVGGRSAWNLGMRDSLYIRNCPSSFLIQGISNLYGQDRRPLLFEVDLPLRIDFIITTDLADLSTFRRKLKQYGLDLVPEKREIDMLLITE